MSDVRPDPSRDLARELDRVADRLRVLGPRWEARADADAGAQQRVRQVLQELADLAADDAGEPRRPVPQLAARALGDQVLVLGHDVLDGSEPAAGAALDLLTALRRSL